MLKHKKSELSDPLQRINQIKLDIEKQGWKVNELIEDIEKYRQEYNASWHWNEVQKHCLYLALTPYSNQEALAEMKKYYRYSPGTMRSNLSRGLYQALADIRSIRVNTTNINDKNVTWSQISQVCREMDYFNIKNNFKLENSSIEEFLAITIKYSDEEKQEILNLLTKFINK